MRIGSVVKEQRERSGREWNWGGKFGAESKQLQVRRDQLESLEKSCEYFCFGVSVLPGTDIPGMWAGFSSCRFKVWMYELEEFTCCVCPSISQMEKYFRNIASTVECPRRVGCISEKLCELLIQPSYAKRFIFANRNRYLKSKLSVNLNSKSL